MAGDAGDLERIYRTGSRDERVAHVRALIWRQAALSITSNTITITGVGTIAAMSPQILAPGVAPGAWIRALAVVGCLAYFAPTIAGIVWGHVATRRTMAWFTEGRDPSQAEIDAVTAAPRTTAFARGISWVMGGIIASIYIAIAVPDYRFSSWGYPKTLALLLVFGATVGCSLTYLLNERIFRPYLALILPQDVTAWPRSLSLGSRLLLAWLVVGGAPLLLIAFSMVGLTTEQRDAAAPMLRATSVIAAGLGLVAFLVAGRSITAPLRRLQRAQHTVATGDLSPRLDVADAAEVGQLEAGFNDMVRQLRRQVTAIQESRTRIVEAADTERARIERNLHDGAQQRLLALSFALSAAESKVRDGDADAGQALRSAREELDAAMAELRELARGIHPAILDDEGLAPALGSLAERAPVPTTVTAALNGRLPQAVEITAYFVVAEALANMAKHAGASQAKVDAALENGVLRIEVVDDGAGGADPANGSGLRGLADRVAALTGDLTIDSPPGGGTRIAAVIRVK